MRVCGVTVLCVWCDGIVHTVCVIIEIAVRFLFYKSVNQACPGAAAVEGFVVDVGFCCVLLFCFYVIVVLLVVVVGEGESEDQSKGANLGLVTESERVVHDVASLGLAEESTGVKKITLFFLKRRTSLSSSK